MDTTHRTPRRAKEQRELLQLILRIYEAATSLGIVSVGRDRTVLYANQAALAICQSGDGLTLRKGVLAAADRSAQCSLDRAVRQTLTPGRATARFRALRIERKSMRRDYHVVVVPVSAFQAAPQITDPVAIVLLRDPEWPQPAPKELLKEFYGVTSREAAMANKLNEGKTLEQAAAELQMRYETARTHLRRVFSKTGTSRQMELMILLERLPKPPFDA